MYRLCLTAILSSVANTVVGGCAEIPRRPATQCGAGGSVIPTSTTPKGATTTPATRNVSLPTSLRTFVLTGNCDKRSARDAEVASWQPKATIRLKSGSLFYGGSNIAALTAAQRGRSSPTIASRWLEAARTLSRTSFRPATGAIVGSVFSLRTSFARALAPVRRDAGPPRRFRMSRRAEIQPSHRRINAGYDPRIDSKKIWLGSSVVEQPTHNRQVRGSDPHPSHQ
jgi:hypothetical protein